jgi:hypothetical protein
MGEQKDERNGMRKQGIMQAKNCDFRVRPKIPHVSSSFLWILLWLIL